MTACPACRWENEADSGPCGGCGRDLATAAARPGPAAAPPVAPAPVPVAEQVASVVPAAEPVTIRPQSHAVPRAVEPRRGDALPVDLRRAPRPVESPRPAPAAVREIPVVVAPAASRVATRPGSDGPGAGDGLPSLPPQRAVPGAGASLCPSCGTPVPAGRRFCRCGARLPGTAAPAPGAATAAEGWTAPAFRRAQRAANDGRRVRYDAPLSARTYAVRALAVLLLAGAVGSQVPPWGGSVRAWVETTVEQALPGH